MPSNINFATGSGGKVVCLNTWIGTLYALGNNLLKRVDNGWVSENSITMRNF